MIPTVLTEVHDVEPSVSIERVGFANWRVVVIDQRTRLGGQFGWRTSAWTRTGAQRLADGIIAGIRAERMAMTHGPG